jgi:hypothetical protein
VTVALENSEGTIQIAGGKLTVEGQAMAESAVIVQIPGDRLPSPRTPLNIGVFAEGRRIDSIRATFIGPQTPGKAAPR